MLIRLMTHSIGRKHGYVRLSGLGCFQSYRGIYFQCILGILDDVRRARGMDGQKADGDRSNSLIVRYTLHKEGAWNSASHYAERDENLHTPPRKDLYRCEPVTAQEVA